MAGTLDYSIFEDMKEHEVRAEIEKYVCETEHHKPKYSHLDTKSLIELFNVVTSVDSCEGLLMIASRPFTNLNNLSAAYNSVPILKVIRSWSWYTDRYIKVRDSAKLQEVRNTFNGPALLSNLLPPADHLVGKFGHTALVSGNPTAWKEVIGKIEDVCPIIIPAFFQKEDGYGKKAERREKYRLREIDNFVCEYMRQTMETFEQKGGYPGGTQSLYKRCFSIYFVKIVRNPDTQNVRGYEVKWLDDFTHKDGNGWTKKSAKVTVPLPPYRVYIHDDEVTFAGWDGKSLKAQVQDHEETTNDDIQ
jgi:hypothetical protein